MSRTFYVPGTDEQDLKKVIMSLQQLAGAVSVNRETLTAARTYYVRTDGSDSNNGLSNSATGAFLTIQKVVDVLATIDLATYAVTVQVADGTYTGATRATAPFVGSGVVTIQGNSSTPGNVIISTTSNNCFYAASGARLDVKDMELRTTTSGSCLVTAVNGWINYSNIRFGVSAAAHVFTQSGYIECFGNYAIVGNAQWHQVANLAGAINCSVKTITLSGTPAFSGQFANSSGASAIQLIGNTYSGAATGTRYLAELNSIINTAGGGATYLPGNAGGSTATGGQYA